ncbi:Os11g0226900 [Oryza sativa Japonica Group]|uniref:Os11g0226900 protein n=2 Tax=Oryza sativa subsp. japonica TaxID=39947 RepID=C7J894_ORYSJ|nr:Os11g0226900 [Oryza sativa Japonica Group]BAT13295.1 Os11g0226900 [Oryza sativa Japonica Group]|eukprot:NP_001176438.1 Os11g0226900 [Oryza sativa Japonica Group]
MIVSCFLISSTFSGISFKLVTFSDTLAMTALAASSANTLPTFLTERSTASAICSERTHTIMLQKRTTSGLRFLVSNLTYISKKIFIY